MKQRNGRCRGAGVLQSCILVLTATAGYAQVEPGTVVGEQKISAERGGFAGPLSDFAEFGVALCALGDLDGDGVVDLAVGAFTDGDGGPDRGAVLVLFMNTDGTVRDHQKISDTQGNFTGALNNGDQFGVSLAALGDIDGDGVRDLAVGAHQDDGAGADRGAVWILLLNVDGTVQAHQKISDGQGAFSGQLDDHDRFGASVASLGDLDSDGVVDLAVGANFDDDGGLDRGAVWVLFLNNDGTVRTHQKISSTQGTFTGALHDGDQFGESVAVIGDLDADGVVDLAVGARKDDDGGTDRGAVWVVFLESDGTVSREKKISDIQGSFQGTLDDRDDFGVSVGALGDLNADGVLDLAVGARHDDDGGTDRGAVWMLFLAADGTVVSYQKVNALTGDFSGQLRDGDEFGIELSAVGDLDGDGVEDLLVGAAKDDDGGPNRGALWVLFLDGGPPLCGDAIGYCESAVNSTGRRAEIRVRRGLSVAANDTELAVTHCPPGTFGLFFYGSNAVNLALGDGRLCVSPFAPGLFRLLPVAGVDESGRAALTVDFQALSSGGQIQGGDTWNFQFWFRDAAPGGLGSNLSDAVQVTFCN